MEISLTSAFVPAVRFLLSLNDFLQYLLLLVSFKHLPCHTVVFDF